MFKKYGQLFSYPGTTAFSATGLIARMPISMTSISLILLISATTGEYAIAGLVSASATLATAIAMPQFARIIDRRGQAKVARPLVLINAAAIALAIVAITGGWPHWTWVVLAAVAGGAAPSIGAMVRARWINTLPDKALQQRAFSWESSLDEVVFILGPPLATILATTVVPYAGSIAAAMLLVVGTFLFTGQRDTEPPPATGTERIASHRLLRGPMLTVCAVFLFSGMGFGSIEVIVVAFADEAGHKPLAGLILAVWAAGSLGAGLTFGVVSWKRSVGAQFVAASVLFGICAPLLLLAPNLTVLSALIFFAGIAIAPVLISATIIVERVVPSYALTEGLTWTTTALVGGVTIGAASVGPIIDAYNAHTAFYFSGAAAIVGGLIALASQSKLRFHAVQARAQKLQSSTIDAWLPGGTLTERPDNDAT